MKQFDAATACYLRAVDIWPEYPAPYNNLGAIRYCIGDAEGASLYYKKACDLTNYSTGPLHNLGVSLYQLGDEENAVHYFTRALACVTDNWVIDSAAYLVVIAYLQGNDSIVIEFFKKYGEFRSEQKAKLDTYLRYVHALVSCRETRRSAPKGNNADLLYVLGDSHALSTHGVDVYYNERNLACVATWIAGCKQWHLGNPMRNIYKSRFEREVCNIPRGSYLLLIFGEIDCRHNEGMLKVWEKSPPRSLESIAQATAEMYVKYVAAVSAPFGHRIIICGVPATNLPLGMLEACVLEKLVYLIHIFNVALKSQAIVVGMDFLDVHKLTAGRHGVANGGWHIDEIHLRPLALAAAFESCLCRCVC